MGCSFPTVRDNPIASSLQDGEEAIQSKRIYLVKSLLLQSDTVTKDLESQELQLIVSHPMPLLPQVHDLPQS